MDTPSTPPAAAVTPPATPPVSTPTPAPATPPIDISAILAENARLKARDMELAKKEQELTLRSEFPQITDVSLIAGGTLEERRANAQKLVAMFPKPPAPPPAVPPSGNPGDAFAALQPHGGGTGEQGDQQMQLKMKTDLIAAMKRGDAPQALELCIALQPNAVKTLLGTR